MMVMEGPELSVFVLLRLFSLASLLASVSLILHHQASSPEAGARRWPCEVLLKHRLLHLEPGLMVRRAWFWMYEIEVRAHYDLSYVEEILKGSCWSHKSVAQHINGTCRALCKCYSLHAASKAIYIPEFALAKYPCWHLFTVV